jgi:glycosyltransferase involved in cell wall biosynthesis
MRLLYISYTGMLEPLGQSQVVAYLERLSASHQIDLISFEKSNDWNQEAGRGALRDRLKTADVRWHPLRYHKRLSLGATAYDVFKGLRLARRIATERDVEIVHARSYVASVVALRIKREFGTRFVFDMRGFWPDEKVESGSWSRTSPVYRLAKRFERVFLREADVVVSLTRAGVEAMREFEAIKKSDKVFQVIPTCADLQRFQPSGLQLGPPFTLGYVGNVGGWYRFPPVLEAFSAVRDKEPDARLLVVNRGQHESIRNHLLAYKVPIENVEVITLDFADVPNAMQRMHATAFFIEPTLSKQASAPTKLAEFLGCGVPCLVNDGVGDMGRIVREDGVGVVVEKLTTDAVQEGARRLVGLAADSTVRSRCVASAERRFSLDSGVAAYDRIYRSFASTLPDRRAE